MKRPFVTAPGVAAAVVLTLGLSAALHAQRGTTAPRPLPPKPVVASKYSGPRTPDRKPDLNGIWQVLGTAHWNVEAHSATRGCAGRLQRSRRRHHPVPAGGAGQAERELPESDDGRSAQEVLHARRAARDVPAVSVRNHADAEAHRHCVRVRARDAHGLPGRRRRTWTISTSGWAMRAGSWEGDTLVVDTVSLGDTTWFDQAGNFHSDALKVTERFTPTDTTHINYEVDDRRCQGVHTAVEDEHDHLSPSREESRAAGLRVRRARVREVVQGTSRR